MRFQEIDGIKYQWQGDADGERVLVERWLKDQGDNIAKEIGKIGGVLISKLAIVVYGDRDKAVFSRRRMAHQLKEQYETPTSR